MTPKKLFEPKRDYGHKQVMMLVLMLVLVLVLVLMLVLTLMPVLLFLFLLKRLKPSAPLYRLANLASKLSRLGSAKVPQENYLSRSLRGHPTSPTRETNRALKLSQQRDTKPTERSERLQTKFQLDLEPITDPKTFRGRSKHSRVTCVPRRESHILPWVARVT